MESFNARTGNSARLAALRPLPLGNKIALIGHSMLDQSLAQLASGNNLRVSQQWLWAWPAWVSALSKGRYIFTEDCKFAVSGSLVSDIGDTILTSATALSGNGVGKTQLQAAIDCPASVVAYWSGRNDRANAVLLSTSIAKATRDFNALTAAGKIVLAVSEIPAGSASFASTRLSGVQLTYQLAWVDWLTRTAPTLWPGKVFAVDLWQDMVDMTATATPGDVISARTQDGVHSSALGAYPQAQRILKVLDGLGLPQSYPAIHRRGESYDAVNNPAGNLLGDAGALTQSSNAWSGTFGSTITLAGVRPTIGSQFGSTGGGSALIAAGSFVDTATGRWWQVRVNGTTAAGANPTFSLAPLSTSALLPSLAVGDMLRAYGEFEIDANGTGLCSLSFLLQRNLPSGKFDLTAQTFGNESSGVLDTILAGLPAPLAGTWNGNTNVTIDGTETGLFASLQINMKQSAAVDFTFRVRNLAVRKARL